MRFKHLNDWLNWQENLNPAEIELGLDRISRVLSQANLSNTFNCPLITVAGTNGKGSVVAILESIAMAIGLKVCSYTSPHIFRYNERIKCNQHAIDDAALCAAFDRIDKARDEEPLTYFEFGTLAAIDWIGKQNPDLVIMEVGLGGRLDAVNILEPDVSVLTSVAIDHVDWLGDNRELIGFEKAGVFRAHKTVVCGEYDTPKSVIEHAQKLHCDFYQVGKDYRVIKAKEATEVWGLQSRFYDVEDLPAPSLQGDFQRSNAATAIVALQALQAKEKLQSSTITITAAQLTESLSSALQHISLPGRFQKIHSSPTIYVDVAHNPHAAIALASQLELTAKENQGHTWAIVAMLSDKDVNGVLDELSGQIDFWCFAGLADITRGLAVEDFLPLLPSFLQLSQSGQLLKDLAANPCTILSDKVMLANTVSDACEAVLAHINTSDLNEHDRVIIFGSFYTVAEAMTFFSELNVDTERLN